MGLRLRSALLGRSLRHWHRKLQVQRQLLWQQLNQTKALLDNHANSVAELNELRAAAAETGDQRRMEYVDEKLGEVNAWLKDATEMYAEYRRGYREMITFELERNRYLRESRMEWRRLLAEARIAVVRDMLQSGAPSVLGGVGHPQNTGLPGDVDPDDGGFLPAPGTGMSAEDGDNPAGGRGDWSWRQPHQRSREVVRVD